MNLHIKDNIILITGFCFILLTSFICVINFNIWPIIGVYSSIVWLIIYGYMSFTRRFKIPFSINRKYYKDIFIIFTLSGLFWLTDILFKANFSKFSIVLGSLIINIIEVALICTLWKNSKSLIVDIALLAFLLLCGTGGSILVKAGEITYSLYPSSITYRMLFPLFLITQKESFKDWNLGINNWDKTTLNIFKYGLVWVFVYFLLFLSYLMKKNISFVDYLILFGYKIFCIALIEEFYYRAVLQYSFQKLLKKYKWGNIIAIIVAAFIFGLVHISSGKEQYQLLRIIVTFIHGIALGWIYHKSRNILVPTIIHALLGVMLYNTNIAN